MKAKEHYINRSGWLRASVLGANDGIISTASLVIGVTAGSGAQNHLTLVALAGLVAGAFSMATGEYVSVSSQSDIETADLKREQYSLETVPDIELKELSGLYEQRGLDKDLALQVALQLTKNNALKAHARDELGIHELTKPKPLQAALASGASFVAGGVLPLLVSVLSSMKLMIFSQYISSIVFLALSGAIAAKIGGASVIKGILRICFWGTTAMVMTALVGYLFGVRSI